ncbi:MAG: hypothetical protein KF914_12150 [Rhizobiaceae bacterium]|nr:hypothetical protein [Rhizobiaceae bacterium]
MNLDVALSALKFVSIGSTLGFGVLALLTKYKDEDGKTTKWGKIALIGVFATGLISAATQSIEIARSNQARIASEEKTQRDIEANSRLLDQINRSLNPLVDVTASFWIRVPSDEPRLKAFFDRFRAEVKPIIAAMEAGPRGSMPYGIVGSSRNSDGKVLGVDVGRKSPLFPDQDKEDFAYAIFAGISVDLYFYRDRVKIENVPSFSGKDYADDLVEPDLTMSFYGSDPSEGESVTVQYDVEEDSFTAHIYGVESDEKYWESSGKFVSFIDLEGAQMLVGLNHLMVSFEDRHRANLGIETISLSIQSRKGLWFRKKSLVEHKTADGRNVYEYLFSDKIEDIVATLQ